MKIELLFFTGNDCGVCNALKPKLEKYIKDAFPQILFKEINIQENPGESGKFLVFTIPALILLINGREYTRFVRTFSIKEVQEKLQDVVTLLGDQP